MPKMPYEQWFWNDWFADDAVTEMDLKSRCVWFYLLGRMHQKQQKNITGTLSELARLVGAREGEIKKSLEVIAEKKAGIVEKNGRKYTVICRRDMRKEYENQQEAEKKRLLRSPIFSGDKIGTKPGTKSGQNRGQNRDKTGEDTRANTSEVHKEQKENKEKVISADALERIWNLHPKRTMQHDSILAIAGAIQEMIDRGRSPESAIAELTEATAAYAAATAKWPYREKKYIVPSHRWFSGGGYADDRTTWEREAAESASEPTSGTATEPGPDENELERQREERRMELEQARAAEIAHEKRRKRFVRPDQQQE